MIFGFDDQYTPQAHAVAGAVTAIAVAVVVAVCFGVWRRSITRLEVFVLLATLTTIAGLLAPRQFYDHYTYAIAAFLAVLLGAVVGRYVDAIPAERHHRVGGGVALVAVAATAGFVLSSDTNRIRGVMAEAAAVSPAIAADIPAGSCVVTDYPILLVEADRWDAKAHGCPTIDDPFGLFISADGTPPPGVRPFPKSFVAQWATAFTHARYVVLTYAYSNFVPFNPGLRAMFTREFVRIYTSPHTVIFQARDLGGSRGRS
jgi:hypothetical protein